MYEEGDLPMLLDEIESPLVLILDCIQDPHNLGACLRTADAAGCACVIMPKDKSAPITETVVRVSCGGAHHVPRLGPHPHSSPSRDCGLGTQVQKA